MEIREIALTEDKLQELIALSADCEAENSCHGYRHNAEADIQGNRVFTAEEDGRIIAYLFGHCIEADKDTTVMKKKTPCFEVEELFVIRERRSQGIGRKLFAYMEESLIDEVSFIFMSTATTDCRSILHFYLDELGMTFWNARLFKEL